MSAAGSAWALPETAAIATRQASGSGLNANGFALVVWLRVIVVSRMLCEWTDTAERTATCRDHWRTLDWRARLTRIKISKRATSGRGNQLRRPNLQSFLSLNCRR